MLLVLGPSWPVSPAATVHNDPATAAQAQQIPDFNASVQKLEAASPGTTEYSLFCPDK